ncbi:MAG: archease [Chloroflexi bacterium]|nr:archease [Chloroflexota bacterium]
MERNERYFVLAKADFEVIEHTADVGILARGTTLKEAFANAARGLFSIIVDLDSVEERERKEVEVPGQVDEEMLLVEWLNSLIYLFDVENLLFKRCNILELGEKGLKAECFGERVDPSRHILKTGVKAATYHMLRVEKGSYCQVKVLFDI